MMNNFLGILSNPSFMGELNERFEDVAPECLIYEEGTETSKANEQEFQRELFSI